MFSGNLREILKALSQLKTDEEERKEGIHVYCAYKRHGWNFFNQVTQQCVHMDIRNICALTAFFCDVQ